MKKPTLLILAAGMGSRYGGLKQLDELGPSGETIMDYSIYDAYRMGYRKVVFVIRESFRDDFESIICSKYRDKVDIRLAYQSLDTGFADLPTPIQRTKPWGTGHAVLCAESEIDEPFIAINADDFYGKDAFKKSFDFLTNEITPGLYAMIGYQLNNTLSPHGHVNRGVCYTNDDNYLTDVEELLEIQLSEGQITYLKNGTRHPLIGTETVSMNFWAFHQSIFSEFKQRFRHFLELNLNTPKSEFYIPLGINDMILEEKVKIAVLTSQDYWYGVTYQADKAKVQKALFELSKAGKYPSPLPFQ